jgi:hypothetical protein
LLDVNGVRLEWKLRFNEAHLPSYLKIEPYQ